MNTAAKLVRAEIRSALQVNPDLKTRNNSRKMSAVSFIKEYVARSGTGAWYWGSRRGFHTLPVVPDASNRCAR